MGGIKDEKDKDITQKVIQERGLLDNSGSWHSVLEILLSKIQEANQQQSEKLASVVDRSIKNDKSTYRSSEWYKKRLRAYRRNLERDM